MRNISLIITLLVIIGIPAIAFAKQPSNVYVYGFVRDINSGQPVEGVLVEAINEADTTERASAISDSIGRYIITLVVSGQLESDRTRPPSQFRLLQNYPNPFNPTTMIPFRIPATSNVRLIIYNTLGQKIRELLNEKLTTGSYNAGWDGRNDKGSGVAAGIYFYQLRAGDFIQTRKMVLLDGAVGGGSHLPTLSTLKETAVYSSSDICNLMLTIRATAPGIQTFKQQHLSVTPPYFNFNIEVQAEYPLNLNRNLIMVSEPAANGKIYISGMAGTLYDTLTGAEKITVTNPRTQEQEAMRVDYQGGFPLMDLEGVISDQLIFTLSRNGQPLGDSDSIVVQENIPPVVIDSKPTNGDKDIIIDAIVFVHFSEPVATSTVNNNSFTLTDSLGTPVPGTIGFLNDNTVASFDPTQPLLPLTNYNMTVTTDVTDLQGLPLDSTFIASFTTISDTSIIEGKIAFSMQFSGSYSAYNIHVYDIRSDSLIRLTRRTDVMDDYPDWSPDGTKVVFHREVMANDNIYIMNSDGTFIENLSDLPTIWEWKPSLSPDGNKIAFSSYRNSSTWDIYCMKINGSDVTNLTNTSSYAEEDPDWSPDGSKIVYLRWNNWIFSIVVMQNDGTNQVVLVTSNQYEVYSDPIWSVDGRKITFYNQSTQETYIMNSDGTDLQVLLNDTWRRIAWSPVGKRIAYVGYFYQPPSYYSMNLFSINPPSTTILVPFQEGDIRMPSWSPWPLTR